MSAYWRCTAITEAGVIPLGDWTASASLTAVPLRSSIPSCKVIRLRVHQPRIVDTGTAQRQVSETREVLEMLQPKALTDFGAAKRQSEKAGEALQALQTGIADLGPVETQFLELR